MTKAFLLVALLAACTPVPEPVLPTVPGIDPVPGQPVDLTPGLNDPEADVCNSAPYLWLIGQPAEAATNANIMAPMRVIPLGGLITEEYSSSRINFHLDGAGKIAKIRCG